MKIHPLFEGFQGASPYAVGAALGFVMHVEAVIGPLPAALDRHQLMRTRRGGDLAGFKFAGGWQAPGVHCLMFAKPLTDMAMTLWRAGEVVVSTERDDLLPCSFCGAPAVVASSPVT